MRIPFTIVVTIMASSFKLFGRRNGAATTVVEAFSVLRNAQSIVPLAWRRHTGIRSIQSSNLLASLIQEEIHDKPLVPRKFVDKPFQVI